MEKRTKGCKLLLAAAVLFALGGSFNFIGCSSDSDSGSPTSQNSEVETTIGAITISASAATANEDGTYSVVLTATPNADDTDATDITYVWSLGDDASNVTLGSSSSSTVTATISAKPASATVKVTASATGATSVSATYALSVGYDYTIGALTITASDNDDGSKAISVSADSTATTASDVTIAITLAETVDGLTLTDNGDGTATITNANDTDTTATVVATATATGAASVTAQAEVTVAKAGTTYLYSIGKLTATVGNVSGNTRVVTVTAAETDNAPETITYAYSVDDEEFAVSESSNTTGSVTLTNNSTTTKAVTLTVTATADESTSNSTTANVTVPANETLTISGVTLSATSGSAEQGESVTVTVSGGTVTSSDTARDAELSGELPEVTYAWSTDYSGISFDDSTASEVTITAESTASTGTATITVTASADGAESVTATYTLTVTKAYNYTIYSQNFEDGTSDWTLVNSDYSDYAKVKADDATSNANTSSYIYALGGRSGDTGTQVAVHSIGGTSVSFDVKFDGTVAGKSHSIALLGAKNTYNWLQSDSEILSIACGSSATNGYVEVFTINGTDYLTACAVSSDGSEVTTGNGSTLQRGSTGWLHVKANLDFDTHTMDLTVTKVATGAVVCSVTDLAFMDGDAASNLEYIYAAGAKTYGGVFMDNFVVKSDTDPAVITAEDLAVTLGTAVAAAEDSTTSITAAGGTIDLTASATAATVCESTVKTVSYAWAITSGSDYASLSATSGESVTLTANTNETLTTHKVVVTMTASAENAADVTKTYTLTVAADSTLLSAVSISGDDSVSMGSSIDLTVSGGESTSSGSETVTYTWATTSEAVTLTPSEDGKTCTVAGVSIADSVEVNLKAVAGNVTKTAEAKTISVTASNAELSALTLSAETLSVANIKTGTLTVTPNDGLIPEYTVESSDTDTLTVSGERQDDGTYLVTITPVKNGNATVTVTATKDAKTATATCAVTITDPTKVRLYSQDFDSVTDITSVITTATATYNPTTALALYEEKGTDYYGSVSFNSSNSRGQTATLATGLTVSSDYYIEFDLRLGGPNAYKCSAAQTAQFVLGSSAIATSKNSAYSGEYLLALYNTAAAQAAVQNSTWYLSLDDTGSTVTLDKTVWYHFLVAVDSDSKVTVTITHTSDSSTVYDLGTSTAGADVGATASTFTNINMLLGRATGWYYLDNLEVYNYE